MESHESILLRSRPVWPAVVVGRMLGMLYTVGAGVLLYTLRELRGPRWLLETFCAAGIAIVVASAYMVMASWVRQRSAWGALAGVLVGFFAALAALALATGRVHLPQDWPLPAWGFGLAAGLSMLFSFTALLVVIPARRAIPPGYGPILPDQPPEAT